MDLVTNRKARHDFHIIESFEAGIVLQGTEVKSCRARQISLQEGFIAVEKGEVWLQNVHIAPYELRYLLCFFIFTYLAISGHKDNMDKNKIS